VGGNPYRLAAVPDRVELFDHVRHRLTYSSAAASFFFRGDGILGESSFVEKEMP
jgi:hypothetical protein